MVVFKVFVYNFCFTFFCITYLRFSKNIFSNNSIQTEIIYGRCVEARAKHVQPNSCKSKMNDEAHLLLWSDRASV